jgi:hypothetical protein
VTSLKTAKTSPGRRVPAVLGLLGGLHGSAMRFLRRLKGFVGMLEGLFGMLVCGLVVFFAVMHGGGAVGVGGEFVKFGGSDVRLFGHGVSIPRFLSPQWNHFLFQAIPLRTFGKGEAKRDSSLRGSTLRRKRTGRKNWLAPFGMTGGRGTVREQERAQRAAPLREGQTKQRVIHFWKAE